MPAQLNPYITFDGDAREAMEFYRSVLGGELAVNTFGQYGEEGPHADKIMHARLDTEKGFTLMGADTPPGATYTPGDNITISLSADEADADLRRYWEALSDGGTVTVPMEKQMWGDEFGQCTDRFGISWMVNIAGAQ